MSGARRRFTAGLVAGGALATTLARSGAAHAQSAAWPTRPVRLVVPFAPGGSSEVVARSVAAELTRLLGQSVFVENKPGGAGVVAMSEVAKSAPDGHTLILGHVGTLAVNPAMLSRQPYDVNKDFVPITLLAKVPSIFVVHPDVPARDLREFVAYARQRPGQLSYGSAGNGSSGHLTFEYLKSVAGIFVTHIPYRGTGPQLIDLMAGRIQAASAGLPALNQHLRAGKLRAIATGTARRVPALPEVKTVAEQGYPGFETSQWYGLMAPAGTPAAVIARLRDESRHAVEARSVMQRFEDDGATGIGSTPEEFARFIATEQKLWGDVVRRAGIQPD